MSHWNRQEEKFLRDLPLSAEQIDGLLNLKPTENLGFARTHLYAIKVTTRQIQYFEDIPVEHAAVALALKLPRRTALAV